MVAAGRLTVKPLPTPSGGERTVQNRWMYEALKKKPRSEVR
jgi:hypothetical protein